MSHRIELSDDELGELDELLTSALKSSLWELHRTKSLEYKDYVKRNVQLIERMLKVVQSAEQVPPAA
jgi:hypothetical protein